MNERVRVSETSRDAAEKRFKRATAEMFRTLPDNPGVAVETVVSALNEWLVRQPVLGGDVSAIESQDRSNEPPIVIINPDRPL